MEYEKLGYKVPGPSKGNDYSASLPLEFYHYYHERYGDTNRGEFYFQL